MKSLTQTPKNLLSNWFGNHFQGILIIVFLIWTPLLVAGTLQVQHSCHPMINWSNTLPAECNPPQSKSNHEQFKKDKPPVARSQEKEKIVQKNNSSDEPNQIAQKSVNSPSPKPSPTSTPQILLHLKHLMNHHHP